MRLFDYQKASRLMEQIGADVLLASEKYSVGYLSDYWDELEDESKVLWDTNITYAILCGIPKDEAKGAFLVPPAHKHSTVEAKDPWIKDRRYWGPGYYVQRWTNADMGNPMVEVAEALRERGLEEGRIAIERRYLPLEYFESLRSLLPKAKFLEARPILWSLRAIKSTEEISRTREACRRTVRAWRHVMSNLREGMTEEELSWMFIQAAAAEQMKTVMSFFVFGPSGLKLTKGPPTPGQTELKTGYFARNDVQASYKGYLSDMSRVLAFGKVTAQMERAHTAVKEIMRRLLEAFKPGVSCHELRKLELRLYADAGFKPVVPYTGHSMGRVAHEAPYLTEGEHTALEPGMMISVEPTVTFSGDGDINICFEDTILVTEKGYENLTEGATWEPYL